MKLNGVLAQLRSRSWTGIKQAKDVFKTDEGAAEETWLRAQKHLVHSKNLELAQSMSGAARREIERYELRGFPLTGVIYIPYGYIDKVKEIVDTYRTKQRAAVEDFLKEYDKCVERARLALGEAFNESDYPSHEDMRNKFDIRIQILPPFSTDFEGEEQRQQYETMMAEFKENATAELRARFVEIVDRMANALTDDVDPETGRVKKKRIHNNTIDKVRDFVSMVDQLNIAQDETISDACKRIRGMMLKSSVDGQDHLYTADDFRNDDALRAQLAQSFKPVLKLVTSASAYVAEEAKGGVRPIVPSTPNIPPPPPGAIKPVQPIPPPPPGAVQ